MNQYKANPMTNLKRRINYALKHGNLPKEATLRAYGDLVDNNKDVDNAQRIDNDKELRTRSGSVACKSRKLQASTCCAAMAAVRVARRAFPLTTRGDMVAPC
jgi:hypothetical protein